jgi:dihydroorotate dehydrogenase (fumarate)
MDLSTIYLGLNLRTPLVPAASPLSDSLDNLKRMEDAGASAIVLHSLFEEQIRYERYELNRALTQGTESYPAALSYFPEPNEIQVGPETYLKHIQKAKAAVSIPIIASLNGSTLGGWTSIARQMQQAGADALELNIYSIPTDMELLGSDIERDYLEILKAVKSQVTIPVAVKLSAFFTNFANMAKRLDDHGANGLVLFNRFYQPDIELETLDVTPSVYYSSPMAMRLPLRWVAILYDRVAASLAATSGIHGGTDAVKMLLVGADVTMLCSVLLRHGIAQIKVIERELRQWMQEHEYSSVEQMKGSLSHKHCEDPSAFERAQYIRTLRTFKPA